MKWHKKTFTCPGGGWGGSRAMSCLPPGPQIAHILKEKRKGGGFETASWGLEEQFGRIEMFLLCIFPVAQWLGLPDLMKVFLSPLPILWCCQTLTCSWKTHWAQWGLPVGPYKWDLACLGLEKVQHDPIAPHQPRTSRHWAGLWPQPQLLEARELHLLHASCDPAARRTKGSPS